MFFIGEFFEALGRTGMQLSYKKYYLKIIFEKYFFSPKEKKYVFLGVSQKIGFRSMLISCFRCQ